MMRPLTLATLNCESTGVNPTPQQDRAPLRRALTGRPDFTPKANAWCLRAPMPFFADGPTRGC
jgi:hypothetical protein